MKNLQVQVHVGNTVAEIERDIRKVLVHAIGGSISKSECNSLLAVYRMTAPANYRQAMTAVLDQLPGISLAVVTDIIESEYNALYA